MIYRKLRVEEAQKFWDMMNELDKETKFMMYEVGEREEKTVNLQALECQIQNSIEDNDFLLIAEVEGEIVGYLSAERGVPNRIKHTAYVVTGVREKYRGCGIGKELFQRLDSWAKENDVTRLELTVICNNIIAKKLYEKNGFVVEGIKKNSMIIDGQYVDEFYMAKLF
ncbi:MAG: GNAT family N-acetyltransferase [Clostridiales bacterium]|nr:GNAT family N-acetyltransferase [Clostridiales bacterium]